MKLVFSLFKHVLAFITSECRTVFIAKNKFHYYYIMNFMPSYANARLEYCLPGDDAP